MDAKRAALERPEGSIRDVQESRRVTFELVGGLGNPLNHGCIEHVRVQILGVGSAAQHRRKHCGKNVKGREENSKVCEVK